jgi:hypothetical protein
MGGEDVGSPASPGFIGGLQRSASIASLIASGFVAGA